MSNEAKQPVLSIVLGAMGRLELAELGFRSWMLQSWDQPYEVIISLFNDQQPRFEQLTSGKNPNCRVIINTYEKPAAYNISAANNLGLHFARGEYVLFANSDVVYPSTMAERFVDTMRRHSLGFASGSRYNLTAAETQTLQKADAYTRESNFDFLDRQWTYAGPPPIWWGVGPWMARRDVALAINGFDASVMCSEEDDFGSRAVHYLKQRGEQSETLFFGELLGFHLYHPGSELFNSHFESHLIIDPRRDRMRLDVANNEATVATKLDDLESLKRAMRQTVKPSSTAKYRQHTWKKIAGRVSAAAKVLIGRR